jgi:hypothetical protein
VVVVAVGGSSWHRIRKGSGHCTRLVGECKDSKDSGIHKDSGLYKATMVSDFGSPPSSGRPGLQNTTFSTHHNNTST